jgi:hypothetical protein
MNNNVSIYKIMQIFIIPEVITIYINDNKKCKKYTNNNNNNNKYQIGYNKNKMM